MSSSTRVALCDRGPCRSCGGARARAPRPRTDPRGRSGPTTGGGPPAHCARRARRRARAGASAENRERNVPISGIADLAAQMDGGDEGAEQQDDERGAQTQPAAARRRAALSAAAGRRPRGYDAAQAVVSSARHSSRPQAVARRSNSTSRHSPARPGTNHWNHSSATPTAVVASAASTYASQRGAGLPERKEQQRQHAVLDEMKRLHGVHVGVARPQRRERRDGEQRREPQDAERAAGDRRNRAEGRRPGSERAAGHDRGRDDRDVVARKGAAAALDADRR